MAEMRLDHVTVEIDLHFYFYNVHSVQVNIIVWLAVILQISSQRLFRCEEIMQFKHFSLDFPHVVKD